MEICCDNCIHLKVLNKSSIFAKCNFSGKKFRPFGIDTREHSCDFFCAKKGIETGGCVLIPIEESIPAMPKCKEPVKVLYLCDRRACEKCSFPTCKHTKNIEHALNFSKDGSGNIVENGKRP